MEFCIKSICGGNSNDILINLELTFSHIYTSTTISIINTLDEEFTNESFGIRDITIFTEQSICGDQVVQENEDCDDGNLIPFDGCFSCQFSCIEGCEICEKGQCLLCRQGWIFQREISYCQRVDTTVPSIQSKFKENLFEGEILNGCQHECKICIQSVCYQCQLEHTLIFGQCYILAEITWEECNSNCLVCRNGLCFKCQQNYQIFDNKCVGICGDQIVQDNEDCDDGNNIELDGCFNCLYSCPRDCNYCEKGICQDLCQKGYYFNNNSCATICGDSIIAGTEQCEDENTIEYDGCYQCQYSCPLYCNDCLNGQCYDCDSGFILSQNICINICGDGLLSILEQCDDGNQINGDGCSKTCELESNYICNLDGQCAYVEYPIPIIEYYQQINQFQYVKMTFSQKVQQKQNLDYKDTIKLRIIDLDQDLFQIIILENQPVQCQIQNVEYIFQIEILTNRLNHPILEVILTEQLYNENQAPLLDLVNYIQLNQPNYISEGEKMISKSIQKVNEYSINALFTVQAVLFLVGNFDSFQIILDALQNQ
ncbi:unnamed protein product [Paramecium sonneborni]|uniref:Insulin-like growth factor binding protein, N-terminal n=1 Tax=Paramecium sonneborni TaxID=65129 RepID=A0A8S1QKS3_9CILI|nr:unnamed protein product [Paramecium sonneborni]